MNQLYFDICFKQVMFELFNVGDKPIKPKTKVEAENPSDDLSNMDFATRIRRIIVAHKVSKAFQARKIAKNNIGPKKKITALMKTIKEGIKDKI